MLAIAPRWSMDKTTAVVPFSLARILARLGGQRWSGASGVDVAEGGCGRGNLRRHLAQGRVGGTEARPGGQ